MSSNNFAAGQIISGSSSSGGSVAIVSSSLPAGRYVSPENQVTGVLNVLPVAQYNSQSLVLADKQFVLFQAASDGSEKVTEQLAPQAEDNVGGVIAVNYKPVASSSYAPSVTGSLFLVASGTIKTTPGNLLTAYVANQNFSGDYWLMFFNQTTRPANGTAPLLQYVIPNKTATGPGVLSLGMEIFTQGGVNFSAGIAWGISQTTSGSLTSILVSGSVSTQFAYV